MKSPLFPLNRVTFTANRIPTAAGVPSLPANCQAVPGERLIDLHIPSQLLLVRVKLPPAHDRKGVHWAIIICPLSSGQVGTMDPGIIQSEQPPDLAEMLGGEGLRSLTLPQLSTTPGPKLAESISPELLRRMEGWATPPESREQIQQSRDRLASAAGLDALTEDQQLILGRVGFDAYGDEPGPHGPWMTYDGKPMPKYEALNTPAGEFTRKRWAVSAVAVLRAAVAGGLLGPAVPLFPGVGFRSASHQPPPEYVLIPRGATDPEARRIDRMHSGDRALVRRCTDGFLWMPKTDGSWEVPPLEGIGQVSGRAELGNPEQDEADLADARSIAHMDAPLEPGQLTSVQANRLGQPYKARPLAVLLSDVGLSVSAEQIAAFSEEQIREARSWAWNEVNGDKGPPPQWLVDSSALSRIQSSPEGVQVKRRPEPDELVNVAEVKEAEGSMGVPAHTVRFKDVEPELRHLVTRAADGTLHIIPPTAEQTKAPEKPATAPSSSSSPAPTEHPRRHRNR